MKANFPLAHAFKLMDEGRALIDSASRTKNGYLRNYTDRSDPRVHGAQDRYHEATLEAAKLGIDETTFLRLWSESKVAN